jgi:hypothetical protein
MPRRRGPSVMLLFTASGFAYGSAMRRRHLERLSLPSSTLLGLAMVSSLALALAACDETGGGPVDEPDAAADVTPDADVSEDAGAPSLCEQLGLTCTDPDAPPAEPTLSQLEYVVPSETLPARLEIQRANNNLDVVMHEGRLFLAFRTSRNHFANRGTVLYVVSTVDQATWRYEGEFSLNRDLREPRLLSVGGRLFLHFALLGTSPLAFEPGGSLRTEYIAPGEWTEPEPLLEETFIPWRTRVIGDDAYLIGYVGGESIYSNGEGDLAVLWFRSDDGETWEPVVPEQPVVLTGGISETDFVFLDDGAVIAVSRNEAGDEDGFGSKICRAEADALGEWRCAADPRKYDSPLVFRHGDRVLLVGRRNVSEDGFYDLGRDDLSFEDQYLEYQLTYWSLPKRCSLWEVAPDTLEVSFLLDLPSAGDTCFASVIPLSEHDYLLYNYTSPVDEPDTAWAPGQQGPTSIYRIVLSMP